MYLKYDYGFFLLIFDLDFLNKKLPKSSKEKGLKSGEY